MAANAGKASAGAEAGVMSVAVRPDNVAGARRLTSALSKGGWSVCEMPLKWN